MSTTNYSGNRAFILFLFLFGITHLSAQEKHAQTGMMATTHNLTSFPASESKHPESWRKYNDPKYYSHPDFGKLPKNAPCENCVEVLEKRTIDERYFINLEDPGQFYLQRALGDLHQFVNGEWVTIDPSLHPVSGTRYESGYLPEQPVIDFAASQTELKTTNGTLRFNNWKLIIVRNGAEANQYTANWSDYTVGSDGAMIHHIFPGIDAEMIIQKGAIKTSFIIKSNEFGVFDQLLFREELQGESPVHAEFSGGTHNRGIGSLKLMAGTTELAIMDEAKLFAKGGPKSLARSGEYVIHSNQVDLLVDYEWINENIASYELVVDPLVGAGGTFGQVSITGSRYNGSCNFTSSCDYNLTFSSPANATITDVNFSFTYSANGTTCWLQDGATRVGLGSCNSPSAAGYYWFCNAIGGGTCTATNQTIFSDISSCLPSPSCTPQSMTFILKFYRSCWGATGCSNTCIGAASPFVVNVIGKTLEYSNTTTPITLSATTVCQGGSITASTSGTAGVPGYTYNWSFSPSGTPSVGSGASTTISFPTSGTITLYSIVTDACGNQITNSRTITVTPGTPPTVTAGGPTTFCAGGSVVLTSSSSTGNTWSNGATTQSITVTTGGSYTVTVASGGGCSATSAATTVTVTPLPATPTITASGPIAFCTGGSVTLTSSSATGNTWSNGATTQSITVSASGTYSVTVTTSGCTSAPASTTVTVNPLPTAPTITTSGPTTFCSGGSVTLTSSATTGNTWSTGATTSSITVSASGSYTVTFMDVNGCSATSAATTVTVNPAPATPTITAGGPTSFCTGGSVTLTSSAGTGNTWSTGATTSSITVSASGSYTVTVSTGLCSATSAPTTVTVNPVPATPTITASGPTTFCSGNSVTLTSSSATGNTWSNGATTQSITVTASGSYTVTVSNGSCSSTSAATTVTVNPTPPVPTITAGGPTTFCSGGSVVLTSSASTGNTWSNGATTQSITVTTGGTFTVSVSNGLCGVISSPITITVNPIPATPTITAGGPTTFCTGGSVTLTSSSATGNTWSTGATTQSITVTTSGSYSVTVSNGSCSSVSAATAVTVNPVPATPTIAAGGPTTFCAGGSVTLTSSSSSGNTWSSGAATQSITVSASGTYSVTVSASGCTSAAASATVIVNPVPATPSIAASGPTTFCAGGSVTLTSSSASGNTWSNGSTTQSITVTASGSYTVTVSNGSCSAISAAVNVTVNPLPAVPTITAGGPTTFCAGGSVTLTSSSASGNTWSNGATTQSITVTASGSYTVTVTTNGCSSVSSATNVTVNPVPTVSAANNGPLCVNQPLNLTATGTSGGSYSWTGPNSFSSTSQNPSIASVTSSDFGVYTVTITVNSCSASASTTVTPNSGTSTAITPAGPFCSNDSPYVLVAASPGGNWSGTGIVNASTGLFDPSVSGAGTFVITYDIPGSCSGASTATIVVNAAPVTNFSADTVSGCPPLAVNFTNSTPSTIVSAQWNFGNGQTSGSLSSGSANYTSSGCYNVSLTVTDNNGCTAGFTKVNFVCLNPAADASFTPSPFDATITHPEIHFINTSSNATSYIWTFGDGGNSTVTSPTHEYDEVASNYTVQLVAMNAFGCQDTARVVVRVLDELVYYIPNTFTPNGDEKNNQFQPVFTSGFDPYSFTLLVFNRWGEVLFESKDAKVGWDGTYNGTLVQEGIYSWTISFKDPNTDKKYRANGHVNLIK